MRILFLSLLDFNSFDERNIYTDLLREFIKNGHDVYSISPAERRKRIKTHFEENGHLLRLKIGNIQKINIIEKGISTLLVESQFVGAIRKYFSNIKFDLVLYSTPPITFSSVVKYVKKRDGAQTYLMLKDIFPQNAVDLKMMKTTGARGLIYKYFREKEKELYSLSDRIGCMSQANVEYLLKHNCEIPEEKVEVCPNCIEPIDVSLLPEERMVMRDRYGIPKDKTVFVYGGNLGKPQDVPFIINCLKKCAELENFFFVIAGSGTERYLLEKYIQEESPKHVKLFEHLAKDEYDKMIACCDVGLIFLDHRFTIPNFPSRLLSYMQAGLSVFACTDCNTDIGKIVVEGGFGWWCESNNETMFSEIIVKINEKKIWECGKQARKCLSDGYSVQKVYSACFDSLTNKVNNGNFG